MTETKTQFEPGTLDLQVQAILGTTADGLPIQTIADRCFPAWSPQWVRERIRRMALAGLLEIDTTTHPAIVRLPGRRN
jgi:hypothetical protein